MPKILLATTSPYKKELFERLGVPFEQADSGYDEGPLKRELSNPEVLSRQLSLAKAKSLKNLYPNHIIIGSDQVCEVDGKILGKSGSYEGSFEQLKILNGKTHKLISSYAILFQDTVITNTVMTKLKMKKLSELQIKNYLTSDNPIDCAGSYKLELNGISLFDSIETEDYSAIIGLPLIKLNYDLCNSFNITIPPEE